MKVFVPFERLSKTNVTVIDIFASERFDYIDDATFPEEITMKINVVKFL